MDKQLTFNEPAFEITKSYRDDSGQMFIEGIASTTSIDLTKERMSPEVIAKMAARLIGKPLRSEHGKGWDDKLGEIIRADVVDNEGAPALWIKARLYDWSSKAKDLFGFLGTAGAKMGLSVAGKINPGGLVKELVSSVGKYIPTYRDVEPTEVSVTDHPANLDTFAHAVTKSLNLDDYNPNEYKKDELGQPEAAAEVAVAEAKPEQHEDVQAHDFLDPQGYTYPADDKHLMPALRHFNNDGARDNGKYDPVKWKEMGDRLAQRLTAVTGERYTYDDGKEKVIKEESHTEKEVNNDMDNNKGNLVSKTIPDSVKQLAKEWGKDIDAEVVKADAKAEETADVEKVEKTEDKAVEKAEAKTEDKAVEKGSSDSDSHSEGSDKSGFSIPTLGGSGSDSGSGSEDSGHSDSGSGSGSGTDISAKLDSLMSDLKNTLESLVEGKSGSGSDSGSTGSDSGSGSEDSGSDKTHTDKAATGESVDKYAVAGGNAGAAADSTSSASSGDPEEDETAKALETLVQAANTMKEVLAKKKTAKALPAKEEVVTDTTSTAVAGETAKALGGMLAVMQDIQKSLAKRDEEFTKLVEKQLETPQPRKGYAIALEKKFTGHVDVGNQDINPELLEKLNKDTEMGFADVHKYRTLGIIPEKYKKEYEKN